MVVTCTTSQCRLRYPFQNLRVTNVFIVTYYTLPPIESSHSFWMTRSQRSRHIGLYRDVWIAAIASSRTRLATLTGAMCKTSQCELRSLRVNSGMLNVVRIVTYHTLPPSESPDSFWIAMAISRQRPIARNLCVYAGFKRDIYSVAHFGCVRTAYGV